MRKKIKPVTIAVQALSLLKDIPADNFLQSSFTNGKDKCCAIGHFQRLTSSHPNDFSVNNCSDYFRKFSPLRVASKQFFEGKGVEADLSVINNRENGFAGYPQPEIKDRVIAVLTDMVNEGY